MLSDLDKWAERNPSTAKVTYVKPEAADSKDDATDPFIKIDRIELATKDPKRWLTELDAKVERSAAMTRTQVAFNCLQWTNQHTRVTVSNDRVYVEADANHYLECMPVDVARIAGLHLAAFPWTVRINLGPAAHVIYRSEDGGGKEWRPRSPDHIKKAFSEIPWVTGVEVTGSHSSHSHGTGSVMVALGAKESGLPRYTEELESEVTRVANRAIEVGVPWTVMITFEHGGRMAFSSERYGRVS
jgi:hypothetical protein